MLPGARCQGRPAPLASAARKVTALPLRGKSESVQRGRDWTEQIITHILQIETGVLNPSKNSKQIDAA